MLKELLILGADILFQYEDDVKYKSKHGFTTKKYRTLKNRVVKYAKKKGIGVVKAADEILTGDNHHIFFQGLKYEGRGNKI